MGDPDRERVRGVRFRGFGEPEQGADHEGDLFFLGAAASDDRLLHSAGCVFVDGDPGGGHGDEDGAAGGAEGDGGAQALDEDNAFHGAEGRFVGADEVQDPFVEPDEAGSLGERGGVAEHAVGDRMRFRTARFEDREPGVAEGRVDGEEADGHCFVWRSHYRRRAMAACKIDPALHQEKKPDWIRVRLPNNPVFFSTKALVSDLRLHTVCESAQCPNRWECWGQGTATFMIAGDRCTRACGFCAVTTAKPFALDADEPDRVAEAVRRMKLTHVVITAVARDDTADGGADHFARTIRAVREVNPGIVIEVLTPDFRGREESLRLVADASPEVFNHNLETVERLTPVVRSRAKYRLSLDVLRRMKAMAPDIVTKSGLMLGLGETEEELFQAMDDLRESGVQVLTLGQYLRPSPQHLPVVEYVEPARFDNYGEIARRKGFEHVSSGPLVRSSYHASDYRPPAR